MSNARFGLRTRTGQISDIILNSAAVYYLLDTYTNAAAAYSLRILSSRYIGSAIRVRRASDSTEQDIGFDGSGDLDTSSLATFCSGTNGFVTTWYDQSGNSNDATQLTAANQPKIYDSSTGVITENGKPAMQFDGSNDLLSISTTVVNTQPVSGFCTYTAELNSFPYGSSSSAFTTIGRRLSGEYLMSAGTVLATGTHPATQVLSSALYAGSSSEAFWNGISVLSGNAGTNADIDVIGGLASGFEMTGSIQEIVLYASDQSASRTGIETNINDYYAIY